MGGSSSAPRDNSAELARQAEVARQNRITTGQTYIDRAFDQYNDDFYNNYQQTLQN